MLYEDENEQGKYKLSGKEHTALLQVMASATGLVRFEDALKERLRAVPGAYRDFRLASKKLDKVMGDLMSTIPIKRLLVLQQEVRTVTTRVYVGPPAVDHVPHVVFMTDDAFVNLMNILVREECLICSRKGKDVKRCEIFKAIERCLPYSADPGEDPEDGTCQLAGRDSIIEEE